MKVVFRIVLMTLPFVLAGIGFVAFTISTKPAPAREDVAERPVAVRFIEARRMEIHPRASGFGLVAPARSYEAIAQVAGTAEYVHPQLKKGDILPAGAELLRISDSDYKLAVAQAQANIRAAEARLAELAVTEENLKTALEIEEETLELKARDLERIKRLFEAGTASQSAYDATRAVYLAQRQKVQSLRNSLAVIPAQRQAQREQVNAQKAALEIARLNLERTVLRLPFAARVAAVSVEVGQLVRSGQTVAAFDGIDAAEVEAQISADRLQKLFFHLDEKARPSALDPVALANVLAQIGVEARVLMRIGEERVEWPAAVDRISNAIDPRTGTIGVIVRVDDAYAAARPGTRPPLTRGMFVEALLEAAPVQAFVVPRSALRDGRLMVADSENRLRLVPVSVLFLQDSVAAIGEGLEEGMRIVVSNPVPMVEGMLLDPRPDRALMDDLAGGGSAGK